jgi:16S rRNA (cytosine967-C5)-methyltransferase
MRRTGRQDNPACGTHAEPRKDHGNLARLGVRNAEVRTHDWTQQTGLQNATFDAALLDVPCSNTGVLRRRVDARWRLSVADFERMPRIQGRILRQAAKQIRSGGRLVYSTCSIEPEENEQVVEAFLRENGGFELLEQRALFPVTDQTDGAFAALLRRK